MYLSNQYSQSLASEGSALISGRQQSRRFGLNENPTYGLYNRNDYMARCYRNCWKLNARKGPELKRLLCFGGQASLSGDCSSSFFFVLILIIPFLSFGLLIPSKSLSSSAKIGICVVFIMILLLLILWHSYSIFIVLQNKKRWINSWFTFGVSESKLRPITTQVGKRFFDIRQHMKFYDVTRDSLPHFPLLENHEKKKLYEMFNIENMNRARIILYTQRYLESSAQTTLYIAWSVLVLTVICFAVSLYAGIIAVL